MVNIRLAIGVDAGHAGHHGGEVREVVPVNGNARRRRHGNQVQGMVGRTTGSKQTYDSVNDRTFVNLLVERTVVAALFGIANRLFSGVTGKCFAQRSTWVNKRGAGQV